jgi:hypothetical protein
MSALPAPWLETLDGAAVATLRVHLPGNRPWVPAQNEVRSIVDWIFRLLAEAKTIEAVPDSAALAEEYSAYASRSLAGLSPAILPPALWWLFRVSRLEGEVLLDGLGHAKHYSQFVTRSNWTAGVDLLETLAEFNGLERGPEALVRLSETSLSLIERDEPLLWRVLLGAVLPVWDPPLLSLWCADPLTARWLAREFAQDRLSVLARPTAPFLAAVTVGWLPPTVGLEATGFWLRLAGAAVVRA